jgi:uncharacterized secreted protein with C-terminal beta-propeller domain
MDESGDYFRIATTKNRSWSQFDDENQGASYSNIYVLDGSLKVVGSLENLAPGEQIFSARFMGKRVYLVTFEQTDPFFAIDLSDPANPRVLGELKIPGFSNYLHPYDDTTIIGLGRDTEENQYGNVTMKGVKVSLFDVADVSKPREVAKYVVDNPSSNSIALTDPKAFLFSKEKNLLVIPIQESYYGNVPIREPFPAPGSPLFDRGDFNGVYVFNIQKDAITVKGKISHDFRVAYDSNRYGGSGSTPVKRSLYIEDILYTLSDLALKMNKLNDLSEVKVLDLIKEEEDDFKVVN